MTDRPVTDRATPGVVAGCAGLVVAVLAMATEQAWLVAVAGLLALVAGLFTLGLADRLSRSREDVQTAEVRANLAQTDSDLMAARAARFEAEAREARISLEDGVGLVPSPTDVARITDEETGLFNPAFFAVTLDKRVASARRGLRPLALAVLEPVRGVADDAPSPAVGRPIADCLDETLRDSDVACRLDAERVAILLEDTPENGAVWTVERVRRRLNARAGDVTLRAGIACYPAHAFDADELLGAAHSALSAARDWHQDRIEVASIPED